MHAYSRQGSLPAITHCSLLLLVVLGSSLKAATVQRFTLEELTDNAEGIFVSLCREAVTIRLEGQLYIGYRFAIIETLKGEEREELELHLPGGRYEGFQTRIPGMPTFVPGERAVLFLTAENHLGQAWPVGLGQGKFRIERPPTAKQARVYQELDGLSFYPSTAAKKIVDQSLQGLPLDQFLNRIRILLPPRTKSALSIDVR